MDSTVVPIVMAALLAVAVLSLAITCICAMVLAAALAHFARRGYHDAVGIIARHQDEAASYYRKACAESIAQGKTEMVVAPLPDSGGQDSTPTAPFRDIADELRQTAGEL